MTPNMTVDDFEILGRLVAAQREVGEIADSLFNSHVGSKKAERHQIGRRLNGVKASLRTVELAISAETKEEVRSGWVCAGIPEPLGTLPAVAGIWVAFAEDHEGECGAFVYGFSREEVIEYVRNNWVVDEDWFGRGPKRRLEFTAALPERLQP